jgi:hypothetical protein
MKLENLCRARFQPCHFRDEIKKALAAGRWKNAATNFFAVWKWPRSKRQRLKPDDLEARNGTAEAVPYSAEPYEAGALSH